MFPCWASRETDVEIFLFGNKNVFALGQKKYFFSDTNWKFCFQNYCFRNWSFTSQTHVSQFSLHEAILASFQCCSLKMFPSHGERATIMNGWPRSRNSQSHKQVIEKGRKRKEERNWKEEDIELLIVYYKYILPQTSSEVSLLQCTSVNLFFRTSVSSFGQRGLHRGSKTFC